jgi:hypothetical protein
MKTDKLRTVVDVLKRFDFISAHSENDVFGVGFDDLGLEEEQSRFGKRLEMVDYRMYVITCVFDLIFARKIKIFDIHISLIALELDQLFFVLVNKRTLSTHPGNFF